jgi:hypothetical protein
MVNIKFKIKSRNLRGREILYDLEAGGREILKLAIKKQDLECRVSSHGSA